MAWITPYTDWVNNPHNPVPTDFNRIEGNIAQLLSDTESGKSAIAVAIVAMGQVTAVGSMTYAQLAALIQAIDDGADATVLQVLAGKKFFQDAALRTGTMPNRSGVSSAAIAVASETGRINLKPLNGYWDGVYWTYYDDADFNPSNFLATKNMFGLQGSIPVRGSEEYAGWRRADVNIASVGGRIHLRIPTGAYLTDDSGQGEGYHGIFADDVDFAAAYFLATKNVFGLQGSIPTVATDFSATNEPQSQYICLRIPSNAYYTTGARAVFYDPEFVTGNWANDINLFGLQGTIPVKGVSGYEAGINVSPAEGILYFMAPAGLYRGNTWVHVSDADYSAANIPYNVNMFGLQGARYDVHPGDNVASVVLPGTGTSGYRDHGRVWAREIPYFVVSTSGTYRVKYTAKCYPSAAILTYIQIYRNGVALGAVRTLTGGWVEYSEDLFFSAGDTCEFWAYTDDPPGGSYGYQFYNFMLCTAEGATTSSI